MQDWLTRCAAEMGRAIGTGEVDAVALTEAHLAAIAAHPCGSRIYARLTPERALAEAGAAAARARAGQRRSPLDGVPISWKDLYDTAGTATEAGSAFLKGRVPDRDAEVLANATRAGLVCLGKTHLTELAFSGIGINPVTATPPNIHGPDLAPGGSSSGAAASVAFGLAAAGIGSDTGGSVRLPAVWNDLVGLKTRSGRLSLAGVVPLCPRLDTVGPLCRSVGDAALLLAALGNGRAPDLRGATLAGARLGILATLALDDLEDAPRVAFRSAVERLEDAGAAVETVAIPEVAEAFDLTPSIYPPEAYATWGRRIEAEGHLMYAPVRDRFLLGAGVSAAEYITAWRRLDECRRAYLAATAGYDAVILPTSPITPPAMQRLLDDAAYFADRNLAAQRNNRIGNLLGLAALTLPTGVPAAGILFQGPDEARLLRIGAAAEAALA